MNRLDLIRWKRIDTKLRAARRKLDTLMDEGQIDKQHELIWKLENKYAKFVLKDRDSKGV